MPNPCLNMLSCIDQGEVRERTRPLFAGFRPPPSQVMPELIGYELGHLTQNHKVVSRRSPRINGSQFPSSVLGILSSFISAPVNDPLFSIPRLRCP